MNASFARGGTEVILTAITVGLYSNETTPVRQFRQGLPYQISHFYGVRVGRLLI